MRLIQDVNRTLALISSAPLLAPACGLLLGTGLAASGWTAPLGLLALAAGLALAWGRRLGCLLAFAALGLGHAEVFWVEPERGLAALELDRPIRLIGVVTSHPVVDEEGYRISLRSRYLEQDRILRASIPVQVWIPGDADELTNLGATLRLQGYLRRSTSYVNVSTTRPGAWRLRIKSRVFVEQGAPPPGYQVWAGRWRREVERVFESPSAGIVLARALVLGDRSAVPMRWRQALNRYGLSHLLAVSGLHVSLLVLLVWLMTTRCPRGLRLGLALLAMVAYLALVGPRPAALRATLMGWLTLSALWSQRPPHALNALAGAVLFLVVREPSIVLNLGFQLSFAATAGILLLAPIFFETWTAVRHPLRQPLTVSVAAQLATLPFLLPWTGVIHPLAPGLNLVAVPWLSAVLAASFVWLPLALLNPGWAAKWGVVLDGLALPIEAASSLSPSGLDSVLMAASLGWILALALAFLGCWPRWLPAGLLLAILLSLQGAAAAPGTGNVPGFGNGGNGELIMVDVGQGDAVVLRDGREALLIDGGGWPSGDIASRVLLPALAASGVTRLSAVAVTHGDLDHCGGVLDLLNHLPVAEIWTSPFLEGVCRENLLSRDGARRHILKRGDRRAVGRWQLDVLAPELDDVGGSNDLSLVLRATFAGRRRVLLTGDAESAAERRMLKEGMDLEADVLKVAHHGSKTSTTEAWLRAVSPRMALISAGRANPYGHPARSVLERLQRHGVRVLRTDRAGRIVLRWTVDGRILIDQPYILN